jgi:uncharacterized protein YutD
MAHLKQLLCTGIFTKLNYICENKILLEKKTRRWRKYFEQTCEFLALYFIVKNINPGSAHMAKLLLWTSAKIHGLKSSSKNR